MADSIDLLGFHVLNQTAEGILARWRELRFVFPINVDVLMKLQRNQSFSNAIRAAGNSVTLVNDSQILKLATRFILGKRFVSRVSGSDLLPALCGPHGPVDARVFLLGGKGDTAVRAMTRLNQQPDRAVVVGAASPSLGFEGKSSECAALVQSVNASGANVLAVGVGAPKQELWMLHHANCMPNVVLFVAVGATLDFVAGNVDRAPRWVSNTGLEWLYRLLREPRRLARRYLLEGPPVFWLLVKQRLGKKVEANR